VFSHDFLPWPTLMLFMLVSYLDNCYIIYVPFFIFFLWLLNVSFSFYEWRYNKVKYFYTWHCRHGNRSSSSSSSSSSFSKLSPYYANCLVIGYFLCFLSWFVFLSHSKRKKLENSRWGQTVKFQGVQTFSECHGEAIGCNWRGLKAMSIN